MCLGYGEKNLMNNEVPYFWEPRLSKVNYSAGGNFVICTFIPLIQEKMEFADQFEIALKFIFCWSNCLIAASAFGKKPLEDGGS